jgi:hypothetical protein
LWNAARSRHRAGDLAAAANLYARYLEEAPATAPDRDKAAAALLELRGSVARLEVHATAGIVDVRVDGTALVGTEKYVDPGEHLVEATGTTAAAEPAAIRKIALAERGESVHVTLEAPTVASRVDGPRSEAASLDAKVAKPRPFAVPWTVVAIGAVATAATAAVTVWSGIDTAQQKDRFDASRSQLDLDDGRARQTRTNVLLGVTLALAAATGIAGVLVDWRGAPAGSVALHVGPAHLDMLGCF